VCLHSVIWPWPPTGIVAVYVGRWQPVRRGRLVWHEVGDGRADGAAADAVFAESVSANTGWLAGQFSEVEAYLNN
jgi:hypothetical protein